MNPAPVEEPLITPNPVETDRRFTGPRVIRSALIFAAVGTALYGLAAVAGDYRAVWAGLCAFPTDRLLLVSALVIVGWFIRGVRFHMYLKRSGYEVRLTYSLVSFLAGFALTGTPGKVGEVVKGVFLKQEYDVPLTAVAGIVLIERVMDLWGVLTLASVSLLLFPGWESSFFLVAAAVIGGGVFLTMERLYRPALLWVGRAKFLEGAARKTLEILSTSRALMTPGVFAAGLVGSTLAWGLESLALYVVLTGFNLPATLLQANFVYAFSTLLGALSMLPGGIGGAEAGMSGLLMMLGIDYQRGLPSVILIRLLTLWAAILVGIICMLLLSAGYFSRRPRGAVNP
jgi:uncharacterized membrane protein YbhN (UPF0104 family)